MGNAQQSGDRLVEGVQVNSCKICGKTLWDRRARYCSDECRNSKTCAVEDNGIICGKKSYSGFTCPMHIKRMQSWGSYTIRPPRECALCGGEFVPAANFENYCSDKCRATVRSAYNKWYFSDETKKAERSLRRTLQSGLQPYVNWRPDSVYDYGSFISNHQQKFKKRDDIVVIEFTVRDLELRMSMFGFSCWLCDGPFEAIDHVKPIDAHGAHMLCNLRPICNYCNGRKHSVWPFSAVLEKFAIVRDLTERWRRGEWTTATRLTRNMDMGFLFCDEESVS